jgi:hypothetical protein
MRIAGEPGLPGRAPLSRYRERVAAGAAEPEDQPGEGVGRNIAAACEARQWCRAVLNQPRPDVRPIGAARQAHQAHPQQPVDIGGGEPGDAEHIGNRPGLGLDAEQAKLERLLYRAGEMVVDAGDKSRDPVARIVGKRGLDRRHRAGRIEQAQPVVERDRDRAEDLGEAAPRDAAQHFDLRQAQMRVHETERHRQVAVAFGGDKRHEMVVPADLDRTAKRQTHARQRGEALRDRDRPRPVAQSSPGQPHRQPGDAGDRRQPQRAAVRAAAAISRDPSTSRSDRPARRGWSARSSGLRRARWAGRTSCDGCNAPKPRRRRSRRAISRLAGADGAAPGMTSQTKRPGVRIWAIPADRS